MNDLQASESTSFGRFVLLSFIMFISSFEAVKKCRNGAWLIGEGFAAASAGMILSFRFVVLGGVLHF